jgi:hypothetical protein
MPEESTAPDLMMFTRRAIESAVAGDLDATMSFYRVGGSGRVQLRYACITEWANRVIVHVTNYTDIDEGRAVAERLAEERDR